MFRPCLQRCARPSPATGFGLAGLLWALTLAACAAVPVAAPTAPPVAAALASPPPALPERPSADAAALALADAAVARAPKPLRIVSTEGRLPGDAVRKASEDARVDWFAMLALAHAAQQTGKAPYAAALDRYFSAWAATFEPQANPISETPFVLVVLAYELGGQYLGLPTQVATQRLFVKALDALFEPGRIRPGTERNNWQSHRLKLSAALAFALRDKQRIGYIRALFQQQLGVNIEPDGRVRDFVERDALHYTVYSLEPLLTAAWIARQHGEYWYALKGRNGATLAQALRWLAPYATGEKTHLEFERSTVAFDRERRAAGVPGFAGPWNPAEAVDSYAIAARLDPAWIALSARLGRGSDWLAWTDALPTIKP